MFGGLGGRRIVAAAGRIDEFALPRAVAGSTTSAGALVAGFKRSRLANAATDRQRLVPTAAS
jgi:hypothetical protein